jgi:hypothetical protein
MKHDEDPNQKEEPTRCLAVVPSLLSHQLPLSLDFGQSYNYNRIMSWYGALAGLPWDDDRKEEDDEMNLFKSGGGDSKMSLPSASFFFFFFKKS